LHPAFRPHNHSPALEVCPNGDVLMIIYTSYDEYEPGVSMMATRLRFGADQWDMPCQIFDFVDLNDHAPMLWNNNGIIWFFWGNPKFGTGSAYPFQWTTSIDNGATWGEVEFPNFKGKIGCHSKQPINTALRDLAKTMYVSSDGCGGRSVLWASPDNGKTWYDRGGRTYGRHTTFVLLKDGSILGMGGKNTEYEETGYMPKSISRDGGRTWEEKITPFPKQGSNQRPSVMRLQSGRIFFAGDFQDPGGASPESITERGSYVALSEDEGKTWHTKKLIGTQQHEDRNRLGGAETVGYSAARQAPNGLIHLITTMNRPCLHIVFNEAWILAKNTKYDDMSDAELMQPSATRISKLEEFKKKYSNGKTKATWSGGVADNGRFLLDGPDTWYYRNGQRQYEVTYKLGRKVGKETYRAPDGTVKWEWDHRDDGTSVWTQWYSAGNPQDALRRKKAESTWRNFKCDGVATRWDRDGNVISEVKFVDGLPSRE
jgi:antitoxin component YwqK of YwqJK toxin-antitoxin module